MSQRIKPAICPLCAATMLWVATGYNHNKRQLACQGCGLLSPRGYTYKEVLSKFEPILNMKKEEMK